MSRSRRKTPMITLQQGDKTGVAKKAKRLANRAVRASNDVPSGRAYKKYSCSWNICDFKTFDSKNEKAWRK